MESGHWFCYFEINWLPVLGFMVGDGGGTLELFFLILQLYVCYLSPPVDLAPPRIQQPHSGVPNSCYDIICNFVYLIKNLFHKKTCFINLFHIDF